MRISVVKAAKLHLYDIEFDDGSVGAIDKTVWEHSGYREGDEIDPHQWEALFTLSQTHRAREKALYYLSLRDYGVGELVQKLCRAGISRELAQETVSRLEQSGLIDDERYAAALARDMSQRKLYPKRRIAAALREKGFSSEAIENALSELVEEDEKQALELLIKKGYNGKSEAVSYEKWLAKLARYGFSYGASKRAFDLWDELYADEE
ncbi:MAG: regulatory protein RecX [Clostridia bacterium]|nr:regulatory protein RecX [Clostridia bacterium]